MKKIEMVKKRLLQGLPITPRYAIDHFNYYRLSDAVYKLKKRGLNIKTIMIRKKNICFAKYKII